jgi:hypothetical protein
MPLLKLTFRMFVKRLNCHNNGVAGVVYSIAMR